MDTLVKKIKITTKIELISGLHIGGNSENVEIGGIDLPVIKAAFKDNEPYIPASSLKGKMRCLLEQVRGCVNIGDNDEVNKLFGITEIKGGENPRPGCKSKLIVRDSYLTQESKALLENCVNLDMNYTEGKWENSINRVLGTAENPRQIERIPAGAKFDVEFIINVWDEDTDDGISMKELLKEGLSLIENDYLGGCGSRGYGQVKFGELSEVVISKDSNWK